MPIKLNEKELEGLDLLIGLKQSNPHFVDWACVGHVTVQVLTATAVGACAAAKVDPAELAKLITDIQTIPVEKLIEFRKQQG